MADRPDPNGGMETFQRNTAGGTGDQRRPANTAALSASADAADANDSALYNAQNNRDVAAGTMSQADAMGRASNDSFNKGQNRIMGGGWRLFTQALANTGANQLRTGAVHESAPYQGSSFGVENTANTRYRDAPGFFDVQDHDNLQRASLTALLRARDASEGRY